MPKKKLGKTKPNYYIYTVWGITAGGKERKKDYPARSEAEARRRWKKVFPRGRITVVHKGLRVRFLPFGFYTTG